MFALYVAQQLLLIDQNLFHVHLVDEAAASGKQNHHFLA